MDICSNVYLDPSVESVDVVRCVCCANIDNIRVKIRDLTNPKDETEPLTTQDAIEKLKLRTCCRASLITKEVYSNASDYFFPEVESGAVEFRKEMMEERKEFIGHMKRTNFTVRHEGDVWYADSPTELGVSSYASKVQVVDWLEVSVPKFAQSILRRVNEDLDYVLLPRLVRQIGNQGRNFDDVSFTGPEVGTISRLVEIENKMFDEAMETNARSGFVSEYFKSNFDTDESLLREALNTEFEKETIELKNKIRSIWAKTKSEEEVFAGVRDAFEDFSPNYLQLIIKMETQNITTRDVKELYLDAHRQFNERLQISPDDIVKLKKKARAEMNRIHSEKIEASITKTRLEYMSPGISKFQ